METIIAQPTVARKWYGIWWDVWRHPGTATFLSILQEPNADAARGFKWIAVVSLIEILPASLISILSRRNVASNTVLIYLTATACIAILSPVFAILWMTILTGIYHLIAKLFGGKGEWSKLVFCLSAIQAPLFLLATVFGLLRNLIFSILFAQQTAAATYQMALLGLCWALPFLALGIYIIVLSAYAIKVVENISEGKSIAVIFSPSIIVFFALCLVFAGAALVRGINTTSLANLNLARPGLTATSVFEGSNGVGSAGLSDAKCVISSEGAGAGWQASNFGLVNFNVSTLAIDPQTPAILYAGTGGGVYKSTNCGYSWKAANSGLPAFPDIYILAIDPGTPTTLFAGTDSGVYKTTNGGGSWSEADTGLTANQINTLAVDPTTPDTLYAGTGGGVFKSTDGGKSWITTGLNGTNITALAIDPQTPATLYAGRGGMPGGVYKSMDGGGSWVAANTGLTAYTVVPALAIDPHTPAILYAGTGGLPGGAYRSIDGGDSWKAIDTGLNSNQINTLVIDPAMRTTLYAGTPDGVFKSTNSGRSWVATGLSATPVKVLAIDPQTPATMYAGTDGDGVYKYNR
jgi:photosystem II stability/assembly factor-like uncharacterized protein